MRPSIHPDDPYQHQATWGTYPFKHRGALHDLVATPDGRGLWVVDDTHASLWDPVRGAVLWSFPLAAVPPSVCAISPDGALLLVGHVDGGLACHELPGGALRWRVRAVGQGSRAVPSLSRITIDPSGHLAATFAPDELQPTTHLWELATGRHFMHIDASWPLFSPDGKHLLLGGSRLLDNRTWQDVCSLESRPTAAAAFDRSGGQLLVGREDGVVSLWDLNEPTRVWSTTIPGQHGGKAPPVRSVHLSPDGAWAHAVVTSEVLRLVLSDGRLWDRGGFQGTWRVAPTPDGSRLFGIGLRKHRIRLFDLAYRLEIRPPYEHEEPIAHVHMADGSPLAATVGVEGTARLWNLQDGYHVRSFPLLDPRAALLSPGGLQVLLLDSVGAHLHDTATGDRIACFRGFQRKLPRPLAGACFAPDGAILLRDEDHTLLCWDPSTDQERWRKDARARSVQLAQDSDRMWVTKDTGALDLWKISTGEVEATYPALDPRKTQRLAVVGGERVCGVQAEVGLAVRPLAGGEARVFKGSEGVHELLAVAPDGGLALTREAGAVALWDVEQGARVQRIDLTGEGDEARCGAFHPDGRGFLVGTERGVVLSFREG